MTALQILGWAMVAVFAACIVGAIFWIVGWAGFAVIAVVCALAALLVVGLRLAVG